MGMKRCVVVPSILLMLALLVAGDEVGAILLPSQAKDEAAMAMAAPKRPWKCCDRALCTRSLPPICTCMDELFECPSTCKACGPSIDGLSRHVCQDQHVGDPGPICRPWECCDLPSCTRSYPPTCRCMDEVDKCAPTCKSCLPSRSRPSRRVCIDSYFGPFPPACTPKVVAAGGN
ncbi:unnamed protein product [Triticum turgidum subsp. durum]|uniref:Bowman-Birk serine protease inhibitors family domain-containing protein n=1 Tax=Triticum turgidum subsp. durum TaxID=4567 RepID=A0A9R0R935_TRITD|nr:unnamed protein product [Triticum turgidum subsp. durum]